MELFKPGKVYKRIDINSEFGGNTRSGISSSGKFPYIFIFSNRSGKKYGYEDRWENPNVFSYSGGGQIGDMTFTPNNKALVNHKANQKRVFLFQELAKKNTYGFSGELELLNFAFEDIFDEDDRKFRKGLRFFFKRKGVKLNDFEESGLINQVNDSSSDIVTERRGLVTSRVGQGAYRQQILHRWEYKCAVTGFNNLKVLIASHIVPWRDSTNKERIDVNNGILLSPVYDALFDRHFISFENSGKIILSDKFESTAYQKIGVTGAERIRSFNSENFIYLEHHRKELLFKDF